MANLSSKDRLVVAVDGLVDREDGGYASPDPRGLYEAYLGPDPDGTATHRLERQDPAPGGLRRWAYEPTLPHGREGAGSTPTRRAALARKRLGA